jgi:hypothetical protein
MWKKKKLHTLDRQSAKVLRDLADVLARHVERLLRLQLQSVVDDTSFPTT